MQENRYSLNLHSLFLVETVSSCDICHLFFTFTHLEWYCFTFFFVKYCTRWFSKSVIKEVRNFNKITVNIKSTCVYINKMGSLSCFILKKSVKSTLIK